MEFSSARAIEQICWQLRLHNYPRDLNRSRIDWLANGGPPIPEAEAAANGVAVNVNDLTLTRLSHDARLQLYAAFNKPGNFFTCRTDAGAVHKRLSRGSDVTKFLNRKLKQSDGYYECMMSKFALMVLHGIGPSDWQNPDRWIPTAHELADVLIPSRTLRSFENLPFFAIFRSYTVSELKRLTRNARRDPKNNPGWNLAVVDSAIEWADEQTSKLYGGTTWGEYWSPSKRNERFKEDGGVYASDLVQTIDCYQFYYWDDAKKHEGWRSRIIFDAEGGHGAWGARAGDRNRAPSKNLIGSEKSEFLYSSGDRVVANRLSEILHCQFADLSAVAPFRYHSVRSLGFLLYAACHLQNRLRCKFSESVFENLMMYMRVQSLDEAERALKIELMSRGIIDESVRFLQPTERWQPNPALAELGLNEYKQIISDNSSSYVQNQNLSRDRVEKTKFQVMAEVNAMQTLVSAALQQAYRYQNSEYREIVRRFMRKDSLDPDVREFRAQCLRADVPDKYLVPEAWDIEPERILGGGNKTLEMAIAQQLMEWRAAYPPASQQQILRDATLAITDDSARTESLVPTSPSVPEARHDAMVAFGSLMAGAVVLWREDSNRIELTQTLIGELNLAVQQTLQTGGFPTMDRLVGYENVLRHIAQLISEIASDPQQKELAKRLAQASGRIANEVKAFRQRLEQQMQAEAEGQGGNGEAAKLQAQLQAEIIRAQTKAELTKVSHAERTAQRTAQFEMQTEQQAQRHAQELAQKAQDHALEVAATKAKTAAEIETETAIALSREATKPKPTPSNGQE